MWPAFFLSFLLIPFVFFIFYKLEREFASSSSSFKFQSKELYLRWVGMNKFVYWKQNIIWQLYIRIKLGDLSSTQGSLYKFQNSEEGKPTSDFQVWVLS